MADATRVKLLEQHLKENEGKFSDLASKYDEVQSDLKGMKNMLEDVMRLLQTRESPPSPTPQQGSNTRAPSTSAPSTPTGLSSGILGPPPVQDRPPLAVRTLEPPRTGHNGGLLQGSQYKLPKVDYPSFDGSMVRNWLQKANRFFMFNPMLDSQKVLYASLHFQGKAETWFQTNSLVFQLLPWEEFAELLRSRFAEVTNNVVAEFNRLIQTGSVQEYQGKFEELQPLMLQRNPGLTEAYFVDSFIGGLKQEIQHTIQMFYPSTLTLARLQESSLELYTQTVKGTFKSKVPLSTSYKFYPHNSNTHNVSGVHSSTSTNATESMPYQTGSQSISVKKLSPTEMQARRDKGLCYTCDEQYSFGHKCKQKQVYMIATAGEFEEESCAATDNTQSSDLIPVDKEGDKSIEISLNALSGNASYQTLQLQGKVSNRLLTMLVDTGSTHNFLDSNTAKMLGCPMQATTVHSVKVAGGGQLQCEAICQNFQFELEGVTFTSDVRLLPLGGCDLVLGVQWLKTIEPVMMDFSKLQLQFQWKGKPVCLKGCSVPSPISFMSMSALQKYSKHNVHAVMGLLYSVSDTVPQQLPLPQCISDLLEKYADIFAEPHSLPPTRSQDHSICLKEGSTPPHCKPYRYPQVQKNEIELQIRQMLQAGIIQPSRSPFTSPVILIKKKDQTWRMCVDYRQLNKQTVKHPFPIPIIDELLDELHGATMFSKLDLRSGYHQIRVAEADIPKTAFSTHIGHYEFKVMPFGLSNAPATFQGLMNDIFANQLRKYILVFFDDILIYSKNLQEHLQHLSEAFSILRQHQLKVKRSKCQFAQAQIEYLGHLISASGICADPIKIEAVRQWPSPRTPKGLRGFLGLSGYYRRFVKDYGLLARPLTTLLQKDNFKWDHEAEVAF
ncbi:hypothetical protein ACHQM5_013426 [Ranunculus cassubicifolius]